MGCCSGSLERLGRSIVADTALCALLYPSWHGKRRQVANFFAHYVQGNGVATCMPLTASSSGSVGCRSGCSPCLQATMTAAAASRSSTSSFTCPATTCPQLPNTPHTSHHNSTLLKMKTKATISEMPTILAHQLAQPHGQNALRGCLSDQWLPSGVSLTARLFSQALYLPQQRGNGRENQDCMSGGCSPAGR